jgi:hypothetical protein
MKTPKSRRTPKRSAVRKHRQDVVTLRRSQVIGAAIIASSGMFALAATVPNTFSSGSPAVAADVNANFAALTAAVTALETKLASVSLETVNGRPTLRFTGVNVQVVNGQGSTATANGTGNLIVGYDETDTSGIARCTLGTHPTANTIVTDAGTCAAAGGTWTNTGFKSGSHYLVFGTQNNYSRWGGLVGGFSNTSNYDWASVSSGYRNTASGNTASVTGGRFNTASGQAASVSGGEINTASGGLASVSGGASNTASGYATSVSGGFACTVSTVIGWDVGASTVSGCSSNITQ